MTVQWGHLPGESDHNPVQKWINWSKAHQEIIAVAFILIILVAVGVPYYLHHQDQTEKDAAGVLNLGQYYLHSQVDPKNGPFKSEVEKEQQALQTFQRITTDYSGTHTAKLARYYAAKSQYLLGQYAQAYGNFDAASQDLKSSPLGDEAYLGKILCLEGQSQWGPASTLAESFLKTEPESFLVPQIRMNLSEIYLKNQNKDKALEQLKIVAQKFAETDWGKEAARRLDGLKS